MLTEALAASAAAGGAAVVQAAATDAWTGTREKVAGWFGRRDPSRQTAELELLDETARVITQAEDDRRPDVMAAHEAFWRSRIERALAAAPDDQHRNQAARELDVLLQVIRAAVPSGNGSLTVGGDLTIRSAPGSIAAGVINGGAVVNSPSRPERTTG
ncbi:hypothetical protein VR45_40545 [Streptomyces sp. NRRL S-495]|nr:hypothetical protein VR45_40545 [Streptomyces sp. NRRL S-495]